jgi:MFS transporter, ACS family, tartrate transporter
MENRAIPVGRSRGGCSRSRDDGRLDAGAVAATRHATALNPDRVGEIMSDALHSVADVGATVHPRTWRKIAWRIIPLIGVAYVMSYVDRANLGYVAEPMSHDLHITSAQLGLAAGLFFIGYVLVEVPSNLMLRRFGARRWITRILLSWGAVTAATAAVDSPAALYTARILLGFAEAGLGAGILLYLTFWFPRRHQAWALTGFFLMIPLSSIVGSPLAAALLTWGKLLGMTGWRALFVIEGTLTVLIGILIFALLPDRPRDARWLNERDKRALEHALEAEADEQRAHGALTGITQTLRSGRVWALAVVFFAMVFGLYPLAFFLPTMIAELSAHLSTADSTLLAAIPSAAALVAMIAWVPVAGRVGAVRATAIPMAVGALGLLCATFAHSGALFIAAVCISAAGIYTAMSQFFRLPAIGLTGAAAASGFAVINSVSNLGGFAGPYITGAIKTSTGSFTYALLTIALIMAGGLVILCTTGRYVERIGGHSA